MYMYILASVYMQLKQIVLELYSYNPSTCTGRSKQLTDFGSGGVDLFAKRLGLSVALFERRLVLLYGVLVRVVPAVNLKRLLSPHRQLSH